MGSIGVTDEDFQEQTIFEDVNEQTLYPTCANGFMSFNVSGLASCQNSTQTGMKDGILLLSWLITLLRTREDRQLSYEWAYKCGDDVVKGGSVSICLLSNEGNIGLQSNIEDATSIVSRHIIPAAVKECVPRTGLVSLILSTASISETRDEANDEHVLHLEARFRNGRLEIRPVWSSERVPQFTETQNIETMVDTVKICLSNPELSIADCLRPTVYDLNQIWGWNHLLPPTYDFCMHDVVSQRARSCPGKVAISSWDGILTYGQLDHYSSILAGSLRELGVELHDKLPICFEKSRWAVVTVLAVMKAGATIVLMDPTLPLPRLQNMAEQVGGKTIVTSWKQHCLSKSILPNGKLVVVGTDTFVCTPYSKVPITLPVVPPSALMYIVFTSGSTGTPKGVQISHQTYTSSAIPRASAVGYKESSRVLDFASYAFDVSIDSMLLTLANGGCLCIPSDEDRLNDINGVMRRMQVNYAGITPSVARILDLDVISSLSGLGLGGEAASARDVALWGQHTRIIIGYGPCECTIGCTVNGSAAMGKPYVSIGQGNGSKIWIVDPDDHESLMPLGAVGELLVEGPIVGQGYLNDPEKTAAAFIRDPMWLIKGHKGYPGRCGRLYKTGDLGRYDPDGFGEIVFVGRKDTQIKLRGQRVELGEIESHLQEILPPETSVIAEVIMPLGSGGQPTLVVFVALQASKEHNHTELSSFQLPGELGGKISGANVELASVLPRYMVPTAYIPVNYIPTLISGKTDRKRLRQFGATVDLRALDQDARSNGNDRLLSDMEQRLRQVWSLILKVEPHTIRPDDNFFALGGDSLAAMRLVSIIREQGLDLSVTNTFSKPTLTEMTGVVHVCNSKSQMKRLPFSMLSKPVESACIEASHVCMIESTNIEDMYPCTPTQESLFTFSIKSDTAYIAQRVACIPSHISLDSWKKAWETVVTANPILRTRLAQLQEDSRLWQVVLRESILWSHSTDLENYLEHDRNDRMNLGQSLARYALIENPATDKRYMVWTVHHALYDGWSEPLILEMVVKALHNQRIDIQTHMGDFVEHFRDADQADTQEFWRRELQCAVGPQFPHVPSRDFLPNPDTILERHIPLETGVGLPFTSATLLRGAWALVASQHSGSDDVIFGETLTGRDISLPGVESIVGPLIATVPVRVRIDRKMSGASYLQTVQETILARTPHQHMGMQNIRKVSQDAQYACEAPTGLVIQPETEHVGGQLGFEFGDAVREAIHFNPYSLMLACGMQNDGLRVCASFDSSLIGVALVERILAQLEAVCSQLSKDPSKIINEISCLSEAELNQIWGWNCAPPLPFDESSRRLRADGSVKQGSIYPRATVPWVCNPRNPSFLSPIGCKGELWLEGAYFSDEAVETPVWLKAGSAAWAGRTGRVQPTGDIVTLEEDGSMIFVGKKEDVAPGDGHSVDIIGLESHFTEYLSPSIRVAAVVSKSSSNSTQQDSARNLVLFVEQQLPKDGSVDIISANYDMICDAPDSEPFKAVICASIPISVTVALKRLDKFIRNSLESHLVPSAYVVIDKMPGTVEHINRGLLHQLASQIPQDIFDQLREGFTRAWETSPSQESMTASENILRHSWAKILGLNADKIDVDDNFFRLGGDSVLAMKLVSCLREEGQMLTVADIFRNMRLGDAARRLKVNQGKEENSQSYKPFTMLGSLDKEVFLSNVVRPKLANPRWSIQDVYPVTDSQALDVRATIGAPRTSIQYTMMYLDGFINRARLLKACHDLVKSHNILRTVFIEHDSILFQVVLEDMEASVASQQTDEDLEKVVIDLCTAQIESDFRLGSSFLQIISVEGSDNQGCLIIGLSHALYDGQSLPRLLRDLETLYSGEKIVNFETFSLYMACTRDERVRSKAVNYWSKLLSGSALSVLDRKSAQPGHKGVFKSNPIEIAQAPTDITTANLLTAAWALILARRLRKPDVTFGGITSGRNIDMPNVENVMGPCYQYTPIRVPFQPQWKAMDLLQFVQKQVVESSAHDFLGFDNISRNCTQWSSDTRIFDSIVHHQHFEDYDAMPFAGGSCRVEILNPHGNAAYPLKAVSFFQGGGMHVGIVGGEADVDFVEPVLDELTVTIQELACAGAEYVLLDKQMF